MRCREKFDRLLATAISADFQQSAKLNFPYAVYWVWITEMEAGQPMQARKDLSDALSRPECFKPDDWPSQIGNFLLEKITRDQLMAKTKSDMDDAQSALEPS